MLENNKMSLEYNDIGEKWAMLIPCSLGVEAAASPANVCAAFYFVCAANTVADWKAMDFLHG